MKKILRKCLLSALLIPLLSLFACHAQPKNTDIHYASLKETYWKLIQLNGKAVRMAKYQPQETHFILHKKDNIVSGFSGCNQFSGPYQTNKKQLKFSEFMSTLMACLDDDIKEYEFFQTLKKVNNYQINGDKLLLKNNNQLLAIFEAVYL